MARMSAKAQARYGELKRISAKGGSTLMLCLVQLASTKSAL